MSEILSSKNQLIRAREGINGLFEHEAGEWVKYEDVQAEIERLTRENAALRHDLECAMANHVADVNAGETKSGTPRGEAGDRAGPQVSPQYCDCGCHATGRLCMECCPGAPENGSEQ